MTNIHPIWWFIMKQTGWIALMVCFLVGVSCQPSQDPIDELGQQLADWADGSCLMVSINGEPVTVEGDNMGGCSEIVWQHACLLDKPCDAAQEAYFQEKYEAAYDRLQTAVLPTCDLDAILTFWETPRTSDSGNLRRTTPEEVANALSCAGTVTFAKPEVTLE